MNRIKRIIVVALIALAIVGLSSMKNAQASQQPAAPKSNPQLTTWSMSDGMEGDYASRGWGCWVSATNGLGYCSIFRSSRIPYDGVNEGEVIAGSGGCCGGYTSVGRNVLIEPYQAGRTLQCSASFEVAYVGWPAYYVGAAIDVIDSNSWTYIGSYPFTIGQHAYPGPWTWEGTGTWNPPNPNVYIRIGVPGTGGSNRPGVEADALNVSCSY